NIIYIMRSHADSCFSVDTYNAYARDSPGLASGPARLRNDIESENNQQDTYVVTVPVISLSLPGCSSDVIRRSWTGG
ncbi:hypothetical protein, partial [Alcanivorax sp.]|uniref:hypothetical protein n=1 Tax=Alcanivorax sp. TaxID=1872427 RepID=UPI002618EB3F